MEDQTVQLLDKCSSGCRMALNSIDQIEDYVRDKSLGTVIESYKKQHQRLENETNGLLAEHGESGKEPGAMAKTFSWLSTEMKLMLKDDEKEIAKIIMDGCNMGVQTLSGAINQYGDASAESIALAKSLVRTDEAFMDDLKQFL